MNKSYAVDYNAVKDAATLERVLEHYAVILRRVNETTLRGQCPLKTHSSQASTDSFTATLNKGRGGVWKCNSDSCNKGGNAIDFAALMDGTNFHEAAKRLAGLFYAGNGNGSPKRVEPAEPKSEPPKEPVAAEPIGNKPLTFKLEKLQPDHEEIRKRGITVETAKFFEAGFHAGKGSMSGRYCIPIHSPDGALLGYLGRGEDPKWKIPNGFQMHLEVFNLHRVLGETWPDEWQDAVVVVEGAFDVMRLWQAGYPAVGLIGTNISDEQAALIHGNFKRALICFDGMNPGERRAGRRR